MSERAGDATPIRLHPVSVVFLLGSAARQLIGPAIAAVLFARGGAAFWIPVVAGFALVTALFRYLTYRVRLGGTDLTVRTGVLFRNERHVPYDRIQNLNLVRNPLHRWFGVAEVQVETAGGAKPEAILRVLALDQVETLRAHVFAGRDRRDGIDAGGGEPAAAGGRAGRELLRMTPRDVAMFGFLSNRGMVLVAAALGAIWQILPDDAWQRWFEGRLDGIREAVEGTVLPNLPGPVLSGALALVGLVAVFALLRLLSILWGFVKFHGFTLHRIGDDLRAEYGLFTRITATIPRRRVQLFHVRRGWLQRRVGAATVQVETAGGAGGGNDDGDGGVQHLWLAPLIDGSRVDDLRREVFPGVDLGEADWKPLADGAFARMARRNALWAALASAVTVGALGVFSLAVAAVVVPLAVLAARLRVRHTRWADLDGAVAYRSGWWVQRLSLVPVAKIQAVTYAETPFDRRRGMGRVRVDTAGAGRVGHRVSVGYLDAEVARDLHRRLSGGAAATEFRW